MKACIELLSVCVLFLKGLERWSVGGVSNVANGWRLWPPGNLSIDSAGIGRVFVPMLKGANLPEIHKPNQHAGARLQTVFALFLILAGLSFGVRSLERKVDIQTNAPNNIAVPSPAFLSGHINHFGFMRVVSQPLYRALCWIHDHIVSNWGWAILLLALIVNLALLPARVSSVRFQRKMQRIQPQIMAIRERYKGCKMGDPRMAEMNASIFDLQRKEGVGIFGSFLPMLLQMPLLYGFYQMLRNVAELHSAGWLWVHDLGAPDPLHVLPLIFVSTMLLLQVLTPSPGTDPMQRKVMAVVLPALGFFMTWKVAAGLALYMAFGNLVSVAQQALLSSKPHA